MERSTRSRLNERDRKTGKPTRAKTSLAFSLSPPSHPSLLLVQMPIAAPCSTESEPPDTLPQSPLSRTWGSRASHFDTAHTAQKDHQLSIPRSKRKKERTLRLDALPICPTAIWLSKGFVGSRASARV